MKPTKLLRFTICDLRFCLDLEPRLLWLPFHRQVFPIVIGVVLLHASVQQNLVAAATLETRFLRFTLQETTGHCEILDKEGQVTWGSLQPDSPFGTVTVKTSGKSDRLILGACELQPVREPNTVVAVFHPVAHEPSASIRMRIQVLSDKRTLHFSYEAAPALEFQNISPLANALVVTAAGKGYVVVPAREGLLIPADSKLSFTHRFDTYAYEGCHMEMIGLQQKRAALLVNWDDPYVAAEVKSTTDSNSPANDGQRIATSLTLSKSAKTFQLHVLGRGGYVDIAKAYRDVARDKGLLVTWEQKLKGDPDRAKLFGAANIKLWSVLDRSMNEESTKEQSVRLNWTFDEAAQVAEHLKKDLQLDRVLFTIGGWIHRGYDNQHPDILPTAPECGGDAAFSECARRVMKQGYLFCLHDNYQDIYRDSPSWDERFIMKTPDGKLARGGHWAGGLAFLTCSKMALALAQRPQNLPAVKKLSNANAYFIDTTYAAGLQECFDPAHPLTRSDDIKWKQALSDYARQIFGVFGSECGREWAIAHSDFFEGLTGVSGHAYHDAALPEKLGATVVPLFELVYRDCIAMYGKYGYNPSEAAPYVLNHISLGRPLNYHSIPAHLYWLNEEKKGRASTTEADSSLGPNLFTRGDNGWAVDLCRIDRFIKNTYEILCPLNELTARGQMTEHEFLTPDRKVVRTVFGKGSQQVSVIVNLGNSDYACSSTTGQQLQLPPLGFLVDSTTFVAFCSRNWAGMNYASPPLFTLRSLDNRPLAKSRKVRVFHAFGDQRIRLGAGTASVFREAIVDPKAQTNL